MAKRRRGAAAWAKETGAALKARPAAEIVFMK
jgi:hypothetical protein